MEERDRTSHPLPGLLILGASGGVAHALLQLLAQYRHEFGNLVLMDGRSHITDSPFLDHRALRYTFIERHLDIQRAEVELAPIVAHYAIQIVLDLTDARSLPILQAAHRAGASYINTMLNDERFTVPEQHARLLARRAEFACRPHLLCTGMNPGIVNHWVSRAIREHGRPREIAFFEFDSSAPADMPTNACAPFITWSRKEFLHEIAEEPGGWLREDGKVEWLYPNALSHPVNMRPFLAPIVARSSYPRGMLLLHEEVITVGRRFNLPASFVYGIHPASLAALRARWAEDQPPAIEDLLLADNVTIPLKGSDLVGVWLKYDDRDIRIFNVTRNRGLHGTNATYRQVAIGVLAGLRALAHGQVPHGLHFVEDLDAPIFAETVRSHMIVREHIIWKPQPATQSARRAALLRRRTKLDAPITARV
ncbi:MAG: saccharopine dehydrogenase NADP-binding domain-containing protein [Thermoflexales bacterium]|nr:saccharopine dehydrogenase NADP-binding domain-containing protein [Thermoflexales bacterium]MDW8351350.1 saccharopine dehydrogenase NADP-binding domain-containing protein [Anaerolineae bacterium]